MKKIKSTSVSQKDRIVCVSISGAHEFYYQPYKSKERYYLFTTKDYSKSIHTYFRNNGRNLSGLGYGLTIKELYEDRKMYLNPKIGKIFDRLPGMIDYVVSEYVPQNKTIAEKKPREKRRENTFDYQELIA